MAQLSLLELCWDCLAETEQTFFVLAALAYGKTEETQMQLEGRD